MPPIGTERLRQVPESEARAKKDVDAAPNEADGRHPFEVIQALFLAAGLIHNVDGGVQVPEPELVRAQTEGAEDNRPKTAQEELEGHCTYVRGRGTNANEVEHLEERRIKKCEGLRLDSPTLELLVRRGDGDDDGSLG